MARAERVTSGFMTAPRIPVNSSTSKIGKPQRSICANFQASLCGSLAFLLQFRFGAEAGIGQAFRFEGGEILLIDGAALGLGIALGLLGCAGEDDPNPVSSTTTTTLLVGICSRVTNSCSARKTLS